MRKVNPEKNKAPSLKEVEDHFDEWKSVEAVEIMRVKQRNEFLGTRERKEAKFTARLSLSDFGNLKRVAAEKAIPYQTLLGHVIHEYVNGNLVDIKEVKKIFPNLRKPKAG